MRYHASCSLDIWLFTLARGRKSCSLPWNPRGETPRSTAGETPDLGRLVSAGVSPAPELGILPGGLW